MKLLKDYKKRLVFSLALAMLLTALFCGGEKDYTKNVFGFWGMLYPQYCFSQTEPADGENPPEIKLGFRWLHGF